MTTAQRQLSAQARRFYGIAAAFTWMGATEAWAYPLGLIMRLLGIVLGPLSLYFVNQLVPNQSSVGGDYFTFAALGLIGAAATTGGLSAFGGQLDLAVSTGRLENILVEPLRWRVLPFGLAGWPIVLNVFSMTAQFVIMLMFGAVITISGLPVAILLLLGGMAAGHAIGILSASVKVLSKQSDPVLTLYLMATNLLSGTAFPISLLPTPLRWLSYCLPQTYVLSAVRKALMPDGSSIDGPSVAVSIVLLTAFLLVMYPLSLWLFGRALNYARKIGALAGY
jgi:ABC-2 type transport system permease protein